MNREELCIGRSCEFTMHVGVGTQQGASLVAHCESVDVDERKVGRDADVVLQDGLGLPVLCWGGEGRRMGRVGG